MQRRNSLPSPLLPWGGLTAVLGGGCLDPQPLSVGSEPTLAEGFNPSKQPITPTQGTEQQHLWAQAGKGCACIGPEPTVHVGHYYCFY